jgi:hypothetical protein
VPEPRLVGRAICL